MLSATAQSQNSSFFSTLVTFDADGGGIVPGRIGSKERFVRMLTHGGSVARRQASRKGGRTAMRKPRTYAPQNRAHGGDFFRSLLQMAVQGSKTVSEKGS
jgi:hypothetical protein